MVHNITASSDKLTCTDHVNSGKCQDRFGQSYLSKNDSNYLDVKLEIFKEDDNKEFRPVQILTLGEVDFNQFMRLRNQLVIAEGNFPTEEKLSPVLIPPLSKNMDEQVKLAQKVVYVVD